MTASDFSLHDALSLKKSDTIFEVLGKMQYLESTILQTREYSNILPFHHTYFLITMSVVDHTYRADDFTGEKAIQKLDVIFAKKYLDALSAFINNGELKSPWKQFFTLVSETDPDPFAVLLAGINAHINGDLAMSLVDADYLHYEKDFKYVNSILLDEIPKVMSFLVKNQQSILAAGAYMLPSLTKYEFEKIIVRWRNEAWINAGQLQSKKINIEQIHDRAEEIGKQICNIVRITKLPGFLSDLERLSSLV